METAQHRTSKNRTDKLKVENKALREKLALLKKENSSLQKALKESRKILEDLPGPVFLVQKGVVILANGAARKKLEYTEEEILGRNFLDFIHPSSVEYVRGIHQKRVSGKPVPDEYETYLITKAGEAVSCEVRVKKIRHMGQRAFLANLTCVDQRKQREMNLRQSQKAEALLRMALGLNKELNNCLPVLIEHAMHFQGIESNKDKELKPPLKKIETAAKIAKTVAKQMYCLTKSKNEPSDIAILDLKKIVKDAVAITRPRWKDEPEARGLTINAKTYLRKLSPVRGNPEEIRDVFVGMILNAVDALPDGGEIYLTTEESAGLAHVYIQDNGVGISADIKDKIFDPFFTTKEGPWLGLGLSLARAIINRHRGEIEVMSQEGQGATFIIKLPLAKEIPSKKPKTVKNRIKNSHILIVADEGIVKDLLSQIFVSKGGKVTSASNAMECLKLLRKGQFDLIIADINAPYFDSSKIIPKIKKIKRGLPVALVNAKEEFSSSQAFIKLGVDMVIGRPLNIPKIFSLVSDALAVRAS